MEARNITWDEPTIAEHEKERGTRRKINEPKTPYRPPSDFNSGSSVGSAHSDDMRPDAATEGRLAAGLSTPHVMWESGDEGVEMGALPPPPHARALSHPTPLPRRRLGCG
jgi:hypothetical protein